MEKNKEEDDLVSEKDNHGYVTRDMGSNIQRELGEETGIKTPGSLLFALKCSSVIRTGLRKFWNPAIMDGKSLK